MMDRFGQAVLAASASFLFVTLIFAIIFLLCKETRKKTPQIRPRARPRPTPNHNFTPSTTINESASFDPSLNEISMAELIIATKNFATDGIIGDGSFGLVYKAQLSDDVTVAVKKLCKDAFQGFREFQAEMETLGKDKIRHPNLVRILGFCVSGDDRIIIYEFIEKGCLDQWLHETSVVDDDVSVTSSSNFRPPLSWETRIKIIKGVAKGLCYLHTLDTPIIHRDIKASNVLLDNQFEAHIADFGLARHIESSHSHVSTQVAGTVGYMPPEYKEGLMVATARADVYSFGILMIEVATSKRPNWPIKMDDKKEVGLVQWTRIMVKQDRHIEIIDQTMSREGLPESDVKEYFRIACLCTSEIPKERPSMDEVIMMFNHFWS